MRRTLMPRDVVTIAVYMLVFYLVITAFFGFSVGRHVHADASNPFSGPGSQVLGRGAEETAEVQKSGLPAIITVSPSFWLALHAAE